MAESVRHRAEHPARIAVFDFDNTLINGQTGVIFTRYLLDLGYVDLLTVEKVIGWGIKYFLRLPVRQATVREYIFKKLTWLTPADFEVLAQDFHDRVAMERYRLEALRMVQAKRREGCEVLIASATFRPIVEASRAYLRAQGAVGTLMEVDGTGHFTGHVDGEVAEGLGKLCAITQWADANYGEGNWVIDSAFGDHHSDILMLGQSGNPCAVNPCFSLYCKAKQQKWPIARWR